MGGSVRSVHLTGDYQILLLLLFVFLVKFEDCCHFANYIAKPASCGFYFLVLFSISGSALSASTPIDSLKNNK